MNAAPDKDSTLQTPYPSSPREGGEVVVVRLALRVKADRERRWSCVPPTTLPPGKKERVGRLFTANWRAVGAPGRRLIRQRSWAGPPAPPPMAPPPPTTGALAKSLWACHGSVFQLKDFTLLSPLLVTPLSDKIRGQH